MEPNGGGRGADVEEVAFSLVDEGLAAVVASDAHGLSRPPALAKALRALLGRGVETAVARGLTSSGPRRLRARGIPRTRELV
jgi:tyrosine-protein phosphatase YwqE